MLVVVHKSPSTRQSQPMGFSGRLEAISAPTSGKTRKRACPSKLPVVRYASKLWGTSVEWASTHSAPLPTNMTTERAASDHASQAAVGRLIPPIPLPCSLAPVVPMPPHPPPHGAVGRLLPPIPLPCSLAPVVTMPLYRKTVCQALRQSLRGRTFSHSFCRRGSGVRSDAR